MAHSPKHPGFTAAAASIARKEGVSKATADKELGYAKAHASAKAKRANPRLLNEAHGHDHPATAKAQRKNPKLLKVSGVKKKPLPVRVK